MTTGTKGMTFDRLSERAVIWVMTELVKNLTRADTLHKNYPTLAKEIWKRFAIRTSPAAIAWIATGRSYAQLQRHVVGFKKVLAEGKSRRWSTKSRKNFSKTMRQRYRKPARKVKARKTSKRGSGAAGRKAPKRPGAKVTKLAPLRKEAAVAAAKPKAAKLKAAPAPSSTEVKKGMKFKSKDKRRSGDIMLVTGFDGGKAVCKKGDKTIKVATKRLTSRYEVVASA